MARDNRNGQLYCVREYFPKAEAGQAIDENIRLRDFVRAAKSLRNIAVPSMRVRFPYTAGGRWYTVSTPVVGTPLQQIGNTLPESGVTQWFAAILSALDSIHKETSETGPLYHGDVTLENVLVLEPAHLVQLVNSTYLEQFVVETQLPPEHFVEHDLRGAGLIALTLLDGKDHGGDQSQRLDRIRSVALGAMLDYLFRPAFNKPTSAQQLLNFLASLNRAESERSGDLYRAAFNLSGSNRLLPLLSLVALPRQHASATTPLLSSPSLAVPPGSAGPGPATPGPLTPGSPPSGSTSPGSMPREPANPEPNPPLSTTPTLRPARNSPAPAPSQVLSPASAAAPTQPPWKPVAVPVRPKSVAIRIGRFLGATMVVLSILVAGLILGIVLLIRSLFSTEPPKPPTIVARPAVIHRGQSALLQWSAKGFSRVELNGQPVRSNGSRSVTPYASTSYRLTVHDSEGRSELVEAAVEVIPPAHSSRKPRQRVGERPLNDNSSPGGSTAPPPSERTPVP